MTQQLKPREFWIRDNGTQNMKDWDVLMFKPGELSFYKAFKVQEVTPASIDLQTENERLKAQLLHYETDALHTCHDGCTRKMCVISRNLSEAMEVMKRVHAGITRDAQDTVWSDDHCTACDDIDLFLEKVSK